MKTNNLSAVYKHITKEQTEEQKIQLATHKIELGLGQMIDSIAKSAEGAMQKIDKQKAKVETQLKTAIKAGDSLLDAMRTLQEDRKDMINTLEDLQDSARKLGLDPSDVPSYSAGQFSTLPMIERKIKETQDIAQLLESIATLVRKL